MLFFSIIIIYSISLDYKEKNILFYKLFDIEAKEYFLRKLGVLILWFSIILLTVLPTQHFIAYFYALITFYTMNLIKFFVGEY